MHVEQTAPVTDAPRKPRRRRLFVAAVLLGGLIWCAPAIIANTSLRQQILPALAPQYPAGIDVGSASLSWTARVELRDVTFLDEQNETFLHINTISTGETLWRLVTNSDGLHPITIEGAEADIRFRADGSNLEDVIAPFADPTSTIWPGVALEITDSRLKLSSQPSGAEAILDNVQLSVHKSHEQGVPYEIAVSATGGEGTLQTKLTWLPPAELTSPAAGNGQLALETDAFPAQALKPILDRMALNDELAAALTTKLNVSWDTAGKAAQYEIDGDLQTGPLQITSPSISASEELRAEFLRCAVKTSITGETIRVDQLDVDSDLARLRVAGEVDLQSMTGDNLPSVLLSLPDRREFRCDGRMDLAKLAATLPETLHIRAGTQITAGTVDWRILGGNKDAGLDWQGQVSVSQLTAVHEGQTLSWDEPISLDFAAALGQEQGTSIRLNCTSDFLKATVTGDPGAAQLQAECDLDRLAQEAGRFLELGDLDMAGHLLANVNVSLNQKRVTADAAINIEKLYLAGLSGVAWNEPRLDLRCAIDASRKEGARAEIHEGSLQLSATGYQLLVELDSAAQWDDQLKAIPVSVAGRGDLAKILPHIQAIMPLDGWRGEGEMQWKANLTIAPDTISYRDAEVVVDQLRVTGPDLTIAEPSLRIASAGAYDQTNSQFTSPSTTVTTATVNARAQPMTFSFAGDSTQMSATVDVAAQVEDLLKLATGGTPPAAGGGLSARLILSGDAGKHRLQSDVVIDKFVVYDQSNVVPDRNISANVQPVQTESLWNEPRLTVASDVTYEAAADTLRIASVRVDGNKWRITAGGRIDEVATAMNANLTGKLQCNWEQLLAKHRQLIGDELNITGSGPYPFNIKGPLGAPSPSGSDRETSLLARLDGQLQLGWDTADIYGLKAGKAEIDTRLKSGVFRIAPLDIPVSEGRLTAAPRITLDSDPMMFVLPAGPVMENVRLSPEMCHGWLKFVAPMLADSTRVDGRLSMSVTSAKVPLDIWQNLKSVGELSIHSADVRPGPLAQQFLEIAEQIKAIVNRKSTSNIVNPEEAWMKIDDQTVAFRISHQQVYHDSLEIRVRDVVIRTRGTVGLDESIDLIAEIPIQDAWLKDDPLLGAFRGQVIQVPISGTLTRPKVDRDIFQNLARQIGTAAGTKLLENELQNQLQRLFRK